MIRITTFENGGPQKNFSVTPDGVFARSLNGPGGDGVLRAATVGNALRVAAARGLAFLPCWPKTSDPIEDAAPTSDQETLDRWWPRTMPGANLEACNPVLDVAASNVAAIVVEPRGEGAWRELCEGRIVDTTTINVNGTRWMLFAMPTPPLAARTIVSGVAVAVDARVPWPGSRIDGVSVIGYPTNNPIATMPSWLLALARGTR